MLDDSPGDATLISPSDGMPRTSVAVDTSSQDVSCASLRDLGASMFRRERFDAAVLAYREVLRRCPNSTGALVDLAHAHLARAEPTEAAHYLERAVAVEPSHARAHVSLGVAYYELGDFERAWDEFVWFYSADSSLCRRRFIKPLWNGSSLNGRTILLWTDQGIGDTILNLRYLRFLKTLKARVIVECHHPALLPLVAQMADVDFAVMRGMTLPDFDVQAPLVFFPSLLRAPRPLLSEYVPYLQVPPTVAQMWRERLGSSGQKTVGLCWCSNSAHAGSASRSVPIAALDLLTDRSPVRFVSLQFRGTRNGLTPPRNVEFIVDDDWSLIETAALILNLDLVISVDTMVPHLAGALGKRVWTLLRYAPSWRYWGGGSESMWFPTMRLFRQSSPNDWDCMLGQVRAALDAWVADCRDHLAGTRAPRC